MSHPGLSLSSEGRWREERWEWRAGRVRWSFIMLRCTYRRRAERPSDDDAEVCSV